MSTTDTCFAVTPTLAGALDFIGAIGVSAFVDGLEAGVIGGEGAAMALLAVEHAITADAFVPSDEESVGRLASMLKGCASMGVERRTQVFLQIHSLLRQNQVDVAAAIAVLKRAKQTDASTIDVLPFIERPEPNRLLVQMPPSKLGAYIAPSRSGGRITRFVPADVEAILAAVVRQFASGQQNFIETWNDRIVFTGFPDFVEVAVVNERESLSTTLSNLVAYLLQYRSKGSAGVADFDYARRLTQADKDELPRLRSDLIALAGGSVPVAPDKLKSLALASGYPIVFPEIIDGGSFRENVMIPDVLSPGKLDGSCLVSLDLGTAELILAAMIKKFAGGDVTKFTPSFDPVYRLLPGSGKSRIKKTLSLFYRGREVSLPHTITPTTLVNQYATGRGLKATRQNQHWSRILVRKVVAEILGTQA